MMQCEAPVFDDATLDGAAINSSPALPPLVSLKDCCGGFRFPFSIVGGMALRKLLCFGVPI
jgi:hypothetical protein